MGWNSFGGQWPNGDGKYLVVMHAHDMRLEIFIVGNDGTLYHRWQERPGGSWNGKWESLGGKWREASDPVVVVNADGRLEVFMVGNDKEYTTGGKSDLVGHGTESGNRLGANGTGETAKTF